MSEQTYGVDIVPLTILIGEKEYVDRVELSSRQFYEYAAACPTIPKTAAVTPMRFYEAFKKCEGATDIICPLINSTGSSTYSNAIIAADMLKEEGFRTNIHIIDSRGYSMVYGWTVIEGVKKILAGKSVADVLAFMDDWFASAEIYLLAFDLKYMKKSGRINAAAAFLGEMMGLKPLISLNDGISRVEKKSRGEKNLILDGADYCHNRAIPGTVWGVAWGEEALAPQVAEFVKLYTKKAGSPPSFDTHLGGVVGANTGPKAIGVILKGKNRGPRVL
jgi:DegV family protein with EDD domain